MLIGVAGHVKNVNNVRVCLGVLAMATKSGKVRIAAELVWSYVTCGVTYKMVERNA